MKKLLLPLVLLLVLTAPAPAKAVRRATKVTPLFDLRVRQEIMDGVLYFLPDPDRNQMRFRSRGGLSVAKNDYEFKLLLTNEHRGYIHPDNIPFDWNELILDQLWLQWKSGETSLTIGRQNIIWDDGFLMLEGHPYDGSRSIYQNAARLILRKGGAECLDVALEGDAAGAHRRHGGEPSAPAPARHRQVAAADPHGTWQRLLVGYPGDAAP